MAEPTTEALVIVVDTGPSVAARPASVFAHFRQVARAIAVRRLLYHTAREALGLTAVGADETFHSLQDAQEGDYQGVNVLHPLSPATPDVLAAIDAMQVGGQSGVANDLVDCLAATAPDVAMFVGKRKMKKRIVIVTDGGSELQDAEQLAPVAQALVDHRIQVDFVCCGFADLDEDNEENAMLGPPEAVDDQSLTEYLVASHGLDQEVKKRKVLAGTTRNLLQVENDVRMRRIAALTGGVVFELDEALQYLQRGEKRATVPRCKFKGTLDITKALRIPVEIWAKTQKTDVPSAKKLSWEATKTLWDTVDDEEVPTNKQSQRGSVVGVTTTITDFSAVTEKELDDPELIVSGHKYGPDIIPITTLTGAVLDYEPADKELCCLGFVPLEEVPIHRVLGSVNTIVPMQGCAEAWNAFLPLVSAMKLSKKCMIASYVERSRSELRAYSNPKAPALVYLWGHEHVLEDARSQYRLYMAELPTNEGIRSVSHFPPLRASVSEDQRRATDSLVDSMMLDRNSFKTRETFNPGLSNLNDHIVARAATGGREGDLPAVKSEVAQLVNPTADVEKKAGGPMDKVRHLFSLVERPKYKRADRNRGASEAKLDLSEFLSEPATGQADDAQEYELLDDDEDDPELQMNEEDPSADFLRLVQVNRRYREFAFFHLPSKIRLLIRESWKGDYSEAIVSSVRALRTASMEHKRAKEYNELLRSISDEASSPTAPYRAKFASILLDSPSGLGGPDAPLTRLLTAEDFPGVKSAIRGLADSAAQEELDKEMNDLAARR